MPDDLERVVLSGHPQLKIEREQEGMYSLTGGAGLSVPDLPEAVERAKDRIEDCQEAIQEADERVLQGMDSSHGEQNRLLEGREAYAKELAFLSEFVSWAEKLAGE